MRNRPLYAALWFFVLGVVSFVLGQLFPTLNAAANQHWSTKHSWWEFILELGLWAIIPLISFLIAIILLVVGLLRRPRRASTKQ